MTSVIPPPRTLSVSVASPLPAALRRLGAMPFCVANKPHVACACFVPGAVVPWNLYGLKIVETQWALKPILPFQPSLTALARLSLAQRTWVKVGIGAAKNQGILTTSSCEEEATCARISG